MSETIDVNNPEEFSSTVTDEEMRLAVVSATRTYLLTDGHNAVSALYGSHLMGEIFDHWLAKRDTEIFGEGYDTGYGEGYDQGYKEGEGIF